MDHGGESPLPNTLARSILCLSRQFTDFLRQTVTLRTFLFRFSVFALLSPKGEPVHHARESD